jgi:hypothetical protein
MNGDSNVFFLSCQLIPSFQISSSISLNHLVLDHSIDLFPLNFNTNALLSILVVSSLFTR